MIGKPAVAGKPPIVVTATGTPFTGKAEVIAIHYFNSTAGAGRVDIYDGIATPGNLRITLGSDAANGNDSFEPTQPFNFDQMRVVFTTGTGVVTILAN